MAEPYSFGWFDRFCLWYPPGWLILFNRHWQHYHPDTPGWNWLEYLLFLVPGGFYLALLLRWLRSLGRSPQATPESFHPDYQRAFREEILGPIVTRYFRAELHHCDRLPTDQPLIITMNHAGMCFPWDFLCLAYLLGHERGWTIQPLAGVSLFEHPWVVWWLPPGWSRALGGVRAEADAFEAAVAHNAVLLYAPEGLRGPRKGWSQRYQIQTFHPSFITLSDRYQIPILPVVCLGNEFLHPWAEHQAWLAKPFAMPFLPLSPGMIFFLLFPSLGVWALRSKLRYYVQPLYTPQLQSTSENGRSRPYDVAQALRDTLQRELYALRKSPRTASAAQSIPAAEPHSKS